VLLTFALTAFFSIVAVATQNTPAHAATITNMTVTSTGALTAGQPNVAPIVVTYTAPTAMPGDTNNSSYVALQGATWVVAPSNYQCGSIMSVTNDKGLSTNCLTSNGSEVYVQGYASNATNWPANTTWTFTFAANSVILPNAASLLVNTDTFVAAQGGANYDDGSKLVALSGYVAPSATVTFNANGGAGVIANQVSNVAAPLTTNVLSRSGYTFSGWNTAVDGSGTAYADGASYAFTASTTLYAQWTAVLAQTGNQTEDILNYVAWLLMSGSLLFAAGLVTKKKQSTK
jgi:uncharacterized repeat protein (TIGR02543 family)